MARCPGDWRLIGRCVHCNCAIWHDVWEDLYRFENADPDCEHDHPDLEKEEEE